jgi:hypothetical protein
MGEEFSKSDQLLEQKRSDLSKLIDEQSQVKLGLKDIKESIDTISEKLSMLFRNNQAQRYDLKFNKGDKQAAKRLEEEKLANARARELEEQNLFLTEDELLEWQFPEN